jgi:hypothetical protein
LTIEMQCYSDAKKSVPGFRNNVPADKPPRDKQTSPTPASWVVMLFPYMEQKEKYLWWSQHIYDPDPYAPPTETSPGGVFERYSNQTTGLVPCLLCPSVAGEKYNLSYGVNTGQNARAANLSNPPIQFASNRPAEGVCLDQYFNPLAPSQIKGAPAKVSIDYIQIHDGTSNTLLIAENNKNPYRLKRNIEIYWNRVETDAPWNDIPTDVSLTAENLGVNWFGIKIVGAAGWLGAIDKISSCHPGIVVVSFCDGSQSSLNTSIDSVVYARLLMPFDRGGYAIMMHFLPLPPTIQQTETLEPLDESSFR